MRIPVPNKICNSAADAAQMLPLFMQQNGGAPFVTKATGHQGGTK